MLGLTVAFPLPLVLFLTTLALAIVGFVRTKDVTTRMLWLVLGFVELLLALICFVGITTLFYQDTLMVQFVVPLTFSFISSLILLGGGLLLVRGKL